MRSFGRRAALALAVCSWAASAGVVRAQDPIRETSSFQFRLGGFFPAADEGILADNREVFTFEPSDLNGPVFGFSYVSTMTNHLEFGFNADYFEGTELTAYRDFVDEDGFEILHDVTLRRLPLTVDLRLLPGGRYSIRGSRGQYAVRRPVPYIGVGGGLNFWRYEETGDFLDFDLDPPEVFGTFFEENGVAFEGHVLAGLELPVGPLWSVLVEGRYQWSDDELTEDFEGLGKIVMDGATAYVGASVRF